MEHAWIHYGANKSRVFLCLWMSVQGARVCSWRAVSYWALADRGISVPIQAGLLMLPVLMQNAAGDNGIL